MASLVTEDLRRYGPSSCPAVSRAEAAAYTRQFAARSAENFTIVSFLLPRRLRPHFRNVYAFCRWADDLGDETGDPTRSLELLDWWRTELNRCYAGAPRHPVFVALASTVEECALPRAPFDALIDAFEQDQRVQRYDTWTQILDYCTRSANPVGRLVLGICGDEAEGREQRADATCTGLQLANFWQDVRRDILERDRIYIPKEIASAHALDVELLASAVKAEAEAACGSCVGTGPEGPGLRTVRPAARATLADLVQRTWPYFEEGRKLLPAVDGRLRPSLRLFTLGGETVLRRIARQRYDTLQQRPPIGRVTKMGLLLAATAERAGAALARGTGREA